MESTVEELEPTKAKVTVEVDYPELEPFMTQAYKDIAAQVDIPGFRKGHVPPRIIDQRFGRGVVIEQVVNDVLPEYLNEAIMEAGLRPVAQPEVEVVEIPATEGPAGGKLVFTAVMDVVPTFEMPNLVDREMQVPVIEITDEDVDAELDELRSRFASLKNLDRPAEDGDFLTIDLEASVDGEKIDSLADVSYELGSGSMMEGQDEALQGASAGDKVEFTSPIRGGEYAGQDALIEVIVQSVKERELPEVDEDFVMTVSEFDTVEELRDDLTNQVRESKRGLQAVQARDQLLEELLEEVEILLPEAVVQAEVERRTDGDADEEVIAAARERIEADIRKQIFLDNLAEQAQVQVDQQELLDFMMHASQSMGLDMATMLQDEMQIQNMYAELARTKSLVSVLADTNVVDEDGNAVDLSAFTQSQLPEEEEEEIGVVDEDGAFAINVDDLGDDSEFVIDVDEERE